MNKQSLVRAISVGRSLALMLLLTIFAHLAVHAQTRKITGKISASDNGTMLSGATVKVKGANTATTTDADGAFTIDAAPNAILTVTSVGYSAQDVPVNNSTSLAIRMVADPQSMQQVVIVGYGSTKRKDLTGSVASISGDQIAKVPVTTLDQALQGRAAGVQVTNNDGAPGGGVQVQIRGVGSLGITDPLFVVDGYPITGGLNTINPADIASMEILKDASAAAIYGDRAANGVVIITTKRGRKNGTQVSLDANSAIQGKPKEYKILNAQQWGALAFQHASIDGYTALPNWTNADTLHEADWQNAVFRTGLRQNYNLSIRGGSDKVQTAFSAGYFNQKGIVLGSYFTRFNVSANVDFTPISWLKSMTSLKYTRGQTELAFPTGGQGATAGIGYLTKLPPTLDGGNLLTPLIKDGQGNYGYFNPNNQAVKNWGDGPVWSIETQDQRNLTNYFLGSSSLEATLLPGLSIKTNVGINVNDYTGYYFLPSDTRQLQQYGAGTSTTDNFFSQSSNSTFEWLWENTVAYNKTFGDHSVDFVGGYSAQDNLFSQIGGQGNNLLSNSMRDLEDLPSLTNYYGNQTITTLVSEFARVKYAYKDKYLATATIRRDGTSKFAPDHQYGVFPSGSLAWRMKEENFLQNVNWLSDLKLRGSYGETGNQLNLTPFAFLAQYTSGPGASNINNNGYPFNKVYQPGIVLTNQPNANLKWETAKMTDIAVDAGFLNNTLTVTGDYYRKVSRNFLLYLPIPGQSGFTYQYQNVGSILNEGVELTVNWAHTAGQLHYNIGLNVSTIKNELLSLNSNFNEIANLVNLGFSTTGTNNWGTYTMTKVGGPVGEFYGYKSAGVFQTQKEIDNLNAVAAAKYGIGSMYESTSGPTGSAVPGDRKFVDLNNSGHITPDSSQTSLGSPIPKLFGGVTFDGSWKSWDFSVFFYGTYGNKIFNYQERTLESFGSTTGSVGLENIGLKYYENAWTPSNASNRYAHIDANEFNANTRPSDVYVENGSYLRLRNLTIGYTVPLKTTGNFAPKIRVYFTAQNLFTITKYSGADPEIGQPQGTDVTPSATGMANNVRGTTASGIDVGTYPNSRFYTFGFNVTF
jgi:TonB-dependent starch-binding outer membrane protein SusC